MVLVVVVVVVLVLVLHGLLHGLLRVLRVVRLVVGSALIGARGVWALRRRVVWPLMRWRSGGHLQRTPRLLVRLQRRLFV